jgi:hypothetical protein
MLSSLSTLGKSSQFQGLTLTGTIHYGYLREDYGRGRVYQDAFAYYATQLLKDTADELRAERKRDSRAEVFQFAYQDLFVMGVATKEEGFDWDEAQKDSPKAQVSLIKKWLKSGLSEQLKHEDEWAINALPPRG